MKYINNFIFILLVSLISGSASLIAQVVDNGGFENGSTGWNNDCNCTASANCIEINPETVYGGSTPGNLVAEIDGHNNPNTTLDDRILCQEVDCFIPGLFYSLNFDAARRSTPGTPDPVSIQVEIDNGVILSTNIDRSGPFNWIGESLVFQATQTSHLISFRPNFAGSLGMLIDDVNITREYTISIDPVGLICEGDLPLQLSADPADGVWSGTGMSTTGSFDPVLAGPGSHQVTYTLDTAVGCPLQMTEVIVEVTSNLKPEITPIDPVCANADPIQLIGNPAGGQWQGVGSDGIFNPSDFGVGVHAISYTIQGDCVIPDQIQIEVLPNTISEITPIDPICENADPILLIGNPAGGQWQGVGTDGIFNPADFGVGIHVISYTILGDCVIPDQIQIEVLPNIISEITPVDPVCENADPILLIGNPAGGQWQGVGTDGIFHPSDYGVGIHAISYTILGDCVIPNQIQIEVLPNTISEITPVDPICENADPILLIGNPAGGQWQGVGSDGIFNPADFGVSIHDVSYEAPGICPTIDQIEIVVNAVTLPTVIMPVSVCENEGPFLLIADPPNGTWGGIADENGLINVQQFQAGTHPVPYQYTNGFDCTALLELELEIVEAVSAGTSPEIIEVCNDGTPINLFDELVDATSGGSWTDLSIIESGNLVNGILQTTDLEPGDYTFQYSITGTSPCLDDSETLVIQIEDPIIAGESIQDFAFCEGDNMMLNLYDLIQDFAVGGSWSTSDPDNVIILNNSFIEIGELAAGNYAFKYLISSQGVCPDDFVETMLTIHPTPMADAGPDQDLICETLSVNLGGDSSPGGDVIYQWSGDVDNPDLAVTSASTEGTYILTVTHTLTGCFDADTVVVTDQGPPVMLFAHSEDISCYGVADGTIIIDSVSGGTPPLFFRLDGDDSPSAVILNNLEAGLHSLVVIDINECTDSLTFIIGEPDELLVQLESSLLNNETQIACGDSVQLNAVVSGEYDNLVWSPGEEFLDCDSNDLSSCLNPWVSPSSETTYDVFVTNANGCSAESSISLSVDQSVNVFIPNVFNPTGDYPDNQFSLQANSGVVRIQSLKIYSRWGELIFQALDFKPNDQRGIWDGQYDGRDLDPGVFVYKVEILLKNGTQKLYVGDVTLIN